MLLPPLVKTEPITIYNKVNDNYVRTVINGVWFTSTEKSIQSRGALPLDLVSIYIFDFENYISQDYNLTPGHWTAAVSDSKKETFIVRGECPFRFKGAQHLQESLREFQRNYNYKKPKSVKDNRMGPINLQHLVILC